MTKWDLTSASVYFVPDPVLSLDCVLLPRHVRNPVVLAALGEHHYNDLGVSFAEAKEKLPKTRDSKIRTRAFGLSIYSEIRTITDGEECIIAACSDRAFYKLVVGTFSNWAVYATRSGKAFCALGPSLAAFALLHNFYTPPKDYEFPEIAVSERRVASKYYVYTMTYGRKYFVAAVKYSGNFVVVAGSDLYLGSSTIDPRAFCLVAEAFSEATAEETFDNNVDKLAKNLHGKRGADDLIIADLGDRLVLPGVVTALKFPPRLCFEKTYMYITSYTLSTIWWMAKKVLRGRS